MGFCSRNSKENECVDDKEVISVDKCANSIPVEDSFLLFTVFTDGCRMRLSRCDENQFKFKK